MSHVVANHSFLTTQLSVIRPYEFHWVFRFWRSEKAGVTIMPSYLLNNRSGNHYTSILLPQSLSLFGCTRAIRP